MLAGALLLLAAGGTGFSSMARTACLTLTDRTTQVLLMSILLLGILGNLLKQTGALQNIIFYLERLLGDQRLLTAALPALLGILTVPGGAVFSAPLVEQAGEKAGLDPGRQAAANLWFRHALYFSYPLFPSVILAAELSGVNVLTFLYNNITLTAASILTGYRIIFRGIPGRKNPSGSVSPDDKCSSTLTRDLLGLILSIAPLLSILILVIFFDLLFPLALAAGCLVALANGIPLRHSFAAALLRRIKTMVLPAVKLNLVSVVLGIMFFKQALEYSGVTAKIADTMLGLGLPLLFYMFAFPVLVGLLTGDNAASVAIVFPLFLPLLVPGSPVYPAQVAFLYFSSAWGHIFTPTHPCFSLNNAYFKVKVSEVLRLLLWPGLVTVLLAWLQILLLSKLS